MDNPFQDKLNTLTNLDRQRALIPIKGLDFSSNDYLGLANHTGIRATVINALENNIALGAGGSRLLRGNHLEHQDLESFAADFFGAQSALYMSTGYLANVVLFTTLPGRTDGIVFDETIHASAKEGIHAASAKASKFSHNDVDACEDAIKRMRDKGAKQIWIAVESVYSMDGDVCPLADFMDVADTYNAYVIVDEAHATGIYGPEGRGFGATFEGRKNLISLHTCGKALGQSGALVTMPQIIKDYLINTARGFIYTTAPAPMCAVAVQAALKVIQDEPKRRETLLARIDHAHQVFSTAPGTTQILPIMVGEDGPAVDMANRLQSMGFDVRAIRPPTVPEHTARLRISITLNVSDQDIDDLARTWAQAGPS